jgi:cytoskeleton protein RodZ
MNIKKSNMPGSNDNGDLFREEGTAPPNAPAATDEQAGGAMIAEHRIEESVVFAPRFGDRLRAAREARGLDIEACTHALRLPSRLLRQLEANEYGGLDYQVYLAGYLSKYGRFVGVEEAAIVEEIERIKPQHKQPTLVVTGGISHSRYLLDRYMTAAQYVVLTAVIVVPLIWFGVRGTFDRDLARLAPLDAAPVAGQRGQRRRGRRARGQGGPGRGRTATPAGVDGDLPRPGYPCGAGESRGAAGRGHACRGGRAGRAHAQP